MRNSSGVLRSLGSGALVFGLAVTGLAAATSNSAASTAETTGDQEPAQELLVAMERDLDLTTTEAQDRLDKESDARSLNHQLRTDLGDSWAGSYFNGDSGALTVLVTDDTAADTVSAAGVNHEVVTYSEDDLNAIVADLDAQGTTLDDGVTGWYPDTKANTVVVEVLRGHEPAAEELITNSGVDAAAVTVEQTTDTPQLYADIVGGDPYIIGGSGRCSIGIPVEGGFATAGHCGAAGTSVASDDGSGTGTVAGSQFPGADMGYVEADSNWASTPTVNDYDGGTITVAGSEEAPEGASVCRSGSTTGFHCGEIQTRGQTVQYPEGQVQGLTQTDVCAERGDSGGAWLADDQAQGVTSGGSGNCTLGGTTYFQPISPILSEYGLTLLTG